MNYLRKKLQGLMACADYEGYLREVTGVSQLTLTDCIGSDLVSLSVTGNAVQDGTPSPDSPVDIQGCGERTANLVDYKYFFDTCTDPPLSRVVYELKPNTSYTLSTNVPVGGGYASVFLSSGTVETVTTKDDGVSLENPRTVVTDENGKITITFRTLKQPTTQNIELHEDDFTNGQYWVMLIEGAYTADTLPPYEPYGYKVPISVSGNLFDVARLATSSSGYVQDGKVYITAYPYVTQLTPEIFLEMTGLKEGDTFSTCADYEQIATPVTGAMYSNFTHKKSASQELSDVLIINYQGKFTTTTIPSGFNSDNYYPMWMYGGLDDSENIRAIYSNIRVYKGAYTAETMPPYEPYHAPQTINIYTDTPLYGLGDIGDTIELNFDTKTATKTTNISRFVLTDDVSFSGPFENGSTGLYRYYFFSIPKMKHGVGLDGLCNVLPEFHIWNNGDFEHVHFGQNNTAIYLILNGEYSSSSDIVSYLSSQGTTEPYFIYLLDTPVTTDISSLQDWDAMPKLWRGTVTISSAATTVLPSSMTAKYYATKEG